MSAVGSLFGVSIDVAAWDAVGAEVALSCAAVFAHEAGGVPLSGGLAHLDTALSGRLVDLRREGAFTAAAGECLLIPRPAPGTIAAEAVLLVGLGDPDGWSAVRLRDAVRAAAEFALALEVRSAAFAPGMLDSGIVPEAAAGAIAHMADGLAAALRARARLVDYGLAGSPRLERWVFDAGAARLAGTRAQLEAHLRARAA